MIHRPAEGAKLEPGLNALSGGYWILYLKLTWRFHLQIWWRPTRSWLPWAKVYVPRVKYKLVEDPLTGGYRDLRNGFYVSREYLDDTEQQ